MTNQMIKPQTRGMRNPHSLPHLFPNLPRKFDQEQDIAQERDTHLCFLPTVAKCCGVVKFFNIFNI
jgi:hypothetical protein